MSRDEFRIIQIEKYEKVHIILQEFLMNDY